MRLLLAILLTALSAFAQGDVEDLMLLRVPEAASGVSPSSLVTNLVAYWRLDETSGTRYDAVGTNHLTDNNTVGYTTGLITNAALVFSNASEYLSALDSPELSTENSSFSIALWYRTIATNVNQGVCSKYLTTGNAREWDLIWFAHKFQFRYWTNSADTGSSSANAMLSRLGPTNTWCFFAASVNVGSGITNYAFQANSTAGIQEWSTNFPAGIRSGGGAAELRIGISQRDGIYLDGSVDEFGFWKRALTFSEITNLYNGGTGRTYPFTGAP